MRQDAISTPWKAARQAWGLTQPEIADRAAIGQSYYSRVERGVVQPSIGVALRLWAVIPIPRARDPEQWIRWFQKPKTSPVSPDYTQRLAGLFAVAHEGWALAGRTALGLPVTSKIDPTAMHYVAWWGYLAAYEHGMSVAEDAIGAAHAMPVQPTQQLKEWYVTYWIDILSEIIEPDDPLPDYATPTPPDPLWIELAELWPHLAESERQALVVLARRARPR